MDFAVEQLARNDGQARANASLSTGTRKNRSKLSELKIYLSKD
jgi:hypothetical protein